MKKFLAPLLLILAASSTTQAAPPVGTFGHEFTSSKDEPVWSVEAKGDSYKVLTHGEGKRKSAHTLTPEERKAFWTKMAWVAGSHQDSECIGDSAELICYVPTKTRQSIPDLQGYASDFFHYDKVGGIMEIRKISGAKSR
ncbi:MAG: hypothetical protein V4631_22665 [Pseudomonadota bacterium]